MLNLMRVAAAASPSPSPTLTEFQEAVEQWPEPPTWMYIALAVVAVVIVAVILVTVATSIASWNSRKKDAAAPRRTDWIDLMGTEGSGGVDVADRRPDEEPGSRVERDH